MSKCDLIPIVKTTDEQSVLFKNLLSLYNSREDAVQAYQWVYSDEFVNKFGDFTKENLNKTDKNGEPLIDEVVDRSYAPKTKDKDKLEDEVFNRIVSIKKRQISLYKRLRNKLRADVKKLNDGDEKTRTLNRINNLNKRIKNLSNTIRREKNKKSDPNKTYDTFEFLYTEALEDLETLQLMQEQGFPNSLISVAFDTLNFWKNATSSSSQENNLLTKDQIEGKHKQDIQLLNNQFTEVSNNLHEKLEDVVVEIVNKYSSRDNNLTYDDIYDQMVDIGTIKKWALGASNIHHPLVDTIFKMVKVANNKARRQADQMNQKINKVSDKLSYNDMRKIFETDENGIPTGRYVTRYNHRYKKAYDEVSDDRFSEKWFDFYNNENDFVDPRFMIEDKDDSVPDEFLFNSDSEKIKQYRSKLKEKLGEKHFAEVDKMVNNKYEKFKEQRREKWFELISDQNKTVAEQTMQRWLSYSDIFSLHNILDNHKSLSDSDKYFRNWNLAVFIPNKEKYYSNQFREIINNDDLNDFYSMFAKLTEETNLNFHEPNRINNIQFMKKSLMEDLFKSKGGMLSGISLQERLFDVIRESENERENVGENFDLTTGEERKTIRKHLNKSMEEEINDRIEKEKLLNPEKDEDAIKNEVSKQVMQEQSIDLPLLLKIYSSYGLMVKHKEVLDTQLRFLRNELKELGAIETTRWGREKKSNNIPVPKESGGSRILDVVDYFVNTSFYGDEKEDIEGSSKKKLLAKQDKKIKKQAIDRINELSEIVDPVEKIDKQIKENNKNKDLDAKQRKAKNDELKEEREEILGDESLEELKADINKLEKIKEDVGGNITGRKSGKLFIKAQQARIMGYNLPSAVTNMGFGYVANMTEASPGDYTEKEMKNAYKYTIGALLGKNKKGFQKINRLMQRYNMLNKSSQEMYVPKTSGVFGKLKEKIGLYALQDYSEHMVHAPLLIAMMSHQKVNVSTGKLEKDGDVTLWELYDVNGKIKDEYRNENTIREFENDETNDLTEVDEIQVHMHRKRDKLHGNYDLDNSTLIKSKFIGQAVSQLRTWMFESFNTRFEKEDYDNLLGHKVKGRYKTGVLTAGFNLYNEDGEQVKSWVEHSLFQGWQLLLKFAFARNKVEKGYQELSEEGVTELDIINMKKNLREAAFFVKTLGMYYLLKSMIDDDDDEDYYWTTLAVNQVGRVHDDIMFYLNPTTGYRLVKDPLPVIDLYKDISKLATDFSATSSGFKDAELRSGPYKGMNRNVRNLQRLFPVVSKRLQLISMGSEVY